MAFVFKIKYGDSMRRFTVPRDALTGSPVLTFSQLEAKIREYFNVPASAKLVIKYVDKDNDTITLTEDQELHDACVLQRINPLRLDVSVEGQNPHEFDQTAFVEVLKGNLWKGMDMETLKKALEPLMKSDISHKIFADFCQGFSKPSGERPESSNASAKPEPENESNRAPPSDAYHANVQCDACGQSPIVGPRFKSISKHDYDLCLSCFNDLPSGSESDYIRYDRPIPRKHIFGPRMMKFGSWNHPPQSPPFFPNRPRSDWRGRPGDYGARPGEYGAYHSDFFTSFNRGEGLMSSWLNKPDGRFVCDVTIPDGTEVSPGTRFVKIWKLRNSGKVAWAPSTKLIRVGGDNMGSVSAVNLQLPEGGVAPESEVDVAVDLVAPERPGRYVSYWRLVTPYGVKFGHRVWALIQVTPAKAEEAAKEDVNVEVNMKPAKEAVNVNVAEEDVSVRDVQNKEVKNEEVKPEDNKVPEDATSFHFGGGYPTVKVEPVAADPNFRVEELKFGDIENGFSLVDMPKKVEEPVQNQVTQETPTTSTEAEVRVLESMGFTNKDLMTELLQKNEHDLQKTIDDLVAAAEWDPILEELEEMGFYDAETNRRLMIKNNGSVKRVVKELVQMYKDPTSSNV